MSAVIETIVTVILLVIVIYAVISSLRIVRPTEKGLVERLGRYHRFVQGGITFLVPFVDRLIKVNTTERMTPVQRQDVITKDKVFMGVDAVVFYKIKPDETSVKASQYNVANFAEQIDTLARTVLRDIIGSMDMAIANTSRPIINTSLKTALDEQTEKWGKKSCEQKSKIWSRPKTSSCLWSLFSKQITKGKQPRNRYSSSYLGERREKRFNSSCRRTEASSHPPS